MSFEQKNSILIPYDLSAALGEEAVRSGKSVEELFQTGIKLGLIFSGEGRTPSDLSFYIGENGRRKRISLKTDFDSHLEELGLDYPSLYNPIGAREYFINHIVSPRGIKPQPSDFYYQRLGSILVKIASDTIASKFNLNADQKLRLDGAYNGVVVLSNLSEFGQMGDKPIGEMRGAYTPDVADALLLNESIFSENHPDKLLTATHELWHYLSHGSFPERLNEAATDLYACRTTGFDEDVRTERLGSDFKYAFMIWEFMEKIAGPDLVLDAYLEPAVIQETWIKSDSGFGNHCLNYKLLGHNLHDKMRTKLGNISGTWNRWDEVLKLAANNQLQAAYEELTSSK